MFLLAPGSKNPETMAMDHGSSSRPRQAQDKDHTLEGSPESVVIISKLLNYISGFRLSESWVQEVEP